MRRVFLALGVLVCLLGWASPTGADVTPRRSWLGVESPHFLLLGDAGAGALARAATRMEQLRALLARLGPGSDAPPDTTVLVFRDQGSFRPFQPIYNGALHDVGGYFQPGPMNYITLLAGLDGDEHSVAYHEYVHLVVSRMLGEVPIWIGEGLAEFYSTFAPAGAGRVRLGAPPRHHLRALRREVMPLEALVAVDRDSPAYNERDRSTVFYAESWALVHYLQLGNRRAYAAAFPRFVAALTAGRPFAAVCRDVLGVTPEALETELRRYVRRPGFPTDTVALPDPVDGVSGLDAAPVGEAAVHAVLGDLLQRLDGRPDAREHLEHAVSVDPTEPLALAALALMEADAGRPEEARALAARPRGAPTYLSEYYRAMALSTAAPEAAAPDPAIEAALRRSVALNPGFAEGHVELSRLIDERDAASRQEALRLVQRAILLAPARDDYRLQLARVHLLERDTAAARFVLDPLAESGSTAPVRTAARNYLQTAFEIDLADLDTALASSAPGASPAAPARPPADPRASTPAAERAAAAPPAYIFQLRPVRRGERRVFGTWTAIECIRGTAVTLVAGVDGRDLRLRAPRLANVTFISYRRDRAAAVGCGPQTPGPVLLTYRPDAVGSTAGIAVAVEFMPPDYQPQ